MNQQKIKSYLNWSGGKDSSLCLYKILQDEKYAVDALLTSVNAAHDRISMHGVRRQLLISQAASIGLPLHTIELPEQPSMAEYDSAMLDKVNFLQENGFIASVFGDIFLEDLRAYRERTLSSAKINCVFPLWKVPTDKLMEEFLKAGFKAIIVCVNEQYLDKSFCGRLIDDTFIRDLPSNVDICGENGEYHSFVYDGPVFKYPVNFKKDRIVRRTYASPNTASDDRCRMDTDSSYGFYFCDLKP
jgi:uncharacterized protein (TIGR00290 family)